MLHSLFYSISISITFYPQRKESLSKLGTQSVLLLSINTLSEEALGFPRVDCQPLARLFSSIKIIVSKVSIDHKLVS